MGFCSTAVSVNYNPCNGGRLAGITGIKITPIAPSSTGAEMYVIPETAHFESTYAYNQSTGVGIWTTNVFVKIGAIVSENKTSVDSLAGNNVILELTLPNSDKVAIGTTALPAYATAGNMNSGTKYEDDHGFDLTFTAKSTSVPVIIPHTTAVSE